MGTDYFECVVSSSDTAIGIAASSSFGIWAVQGGGGGTAANDDDLDINNPQGEQTDEAPSRRSTAAAINAERSHPIVLEYGINQAATGRDTQTTRLIGNIYQAEFDFRVQGFRLRADVPPNSVRTWTARIFKVSQVAADDYQRGDGQCDHLAAGARRLVGPVHGNGQNRLRDVRHRNGLGSADRR